MTRRIAAIVAALLLGAGSLLAQSLPFAIGEKLNYSVHAGFAGTVGHGSMSIEGPVEMRGSQTYLLTSEFHANLGLFRPFDRSRSWFDPEKIAILRSEKSERHFYSTDTQKVDVFPAQQRWSSEAGLTGFSSTSEPLDELSFIYYVRTLALPADTSYSVSRHYDTARNPVEVRVLGRDTIKTGAGTFATVIVEMRVKDPRHFDREGVIKLYLTDDRFHMPVRIESRASAFGSAVFLLDSFTRGAPSGIPLQQAGAHTRRKFNELPD